MRLHRLRIEAFGPFPDTVRVDFDELSDAGLFLLTGPTGAGKTSVLDAVCFALYGDVPGDRSGARHLRSEHADQGRAPRVELDCTLAGRTLRIVRSPSWQRPKKRGEGTTTEQARVALSEFRAGAWQPLSSRIDEVGQMIGDLLGMTLSQFTQVALLPQGEFQAFLRAGADARQRLLERLFRTARFRDVETWLVERRRELARESEQRAQEISGLVGRIAEVTGAEPPQEWDPADHHELCDPEQTARWMARVRSRLAQERASASVDRDTAQDRERQAEGRLQEARTTHEHRTRHDRALAERERLLAAAPEQQQRRSRLDAAGRAAPVLALARAADAADAAAQRALREVERARVDHGAAARELRLLPVPDPRAAAALASPVGTDATGEHLEQLQAALVGAHRAAVDFTARLRAALPLEAELAEGTRRRRADQEERAALASRISTLQARIEELPGEVAAVRDQVQRALAAEARLPGLEEAERQATHRLRAARRVRKLGAELESATAARMEAVERVQEATGVWLELREQRLAGMAAEIAGRLVSGDDCPVCGSRDHPSPAQPEARAPNAEDERAARRRVDDAEVARESAVDRERGLAQSLDTARHDADGAQVHEAVEAAEGAADQVREARARARTLEELRVREREHERDLDAARTALAHSERQAASLASALTQREARLAGIEEQLCALRGDSAVSLAVLADRGEAVAGTATTALARLSEAMQRRQTLGEAQEAVESAAEQAGFGSGAAAREAVLEPDDRRRLETEIRNVDDRLAAVEAVLTEPAVIAAAAVTAPDPAAAEAAHAEAARRLADAEHRYRSSGRQQERVTQLAAEVADRLRGSEPLRQRADLVAHLAAFAEGKALDNRLQMRLSAYVLAYRLGQVVDAANERLATMSDERYLLEHTTARTSGERRGGLGLLVRDAWSGTTRDPATLSGGETFIVSLALALGLADVVAHEAGGAQVDTLFVDEGFGSLDPETLEDVLATLDGLRSGGRVVGVVSHVTEMRDRIAAKLVVHKAPSGSTLSQVTA